MAMETMPITNSILNMFVLTKSTIPQTGMQMLGKIAYDIGDSQITRNNNFQSFFNSFITLFRSATGESWQDVSFFWIFLNWCPADSNWSLPTSNHSNIERLEIQRSCSLAHPKTPNATRSWTTQTRFVVRMWPTSTLFRSTLCVRSSSSTCSWRSSWTTSTTWPVIGPFWEHTIWTSSFVFGPNTIRTRRDESNIWTWSHCSERSLRRSASVNCVPTESPVKSWSRWTCHWTQTARWCSMRHCSPWFEPTWKLRPTAISMKRTRNYERSSNKFGSAQVRNCSIK